RYQRDVADARAKVRGAPEVTFARAWYDHPRFVEAVADRARAALDEIPPTEQAWSPLVFTAHSVPVVMADGSPYVGDLTTAARAVAERLGHARWSLAYQSRSGSAHEPWLEPARERRIALELTLVEARERLGGTIATERAGGFLIEAGPDSFLSEKPWALALCRRLGLEDRLARTDDRYRKVFVWHAGRLHP